VKVAHAEPTLRLALTTNCVGSNAGKCQAEPKSARVQGLSGRIQRDWRYERPFRTERSRFVAAAGSRSDERWMKIATFNIKNINRRLPSLLDWLKAPKPDVVCLQELKCSERDFPAAPIKEAGYSAVWRGEKTWNGVAILARHREPVLTSTALPGDSADKQARYIEAAVEGILICCLYLPDGNPQPGRKFDFKLAWFRRLERHARTLLDAKIPAVLCGDFNVAPTPIDIYPTKSRDNDALIHPKSRAAFARLVDQGWTDALRKTHPNDRIYTFWHYMRQRWERDAGLRLDHLLLSPPLALRLEDAGVDRAVRGLENASDHAPVWVKLRRETKLRARKRKATDTTEASKPRQSWRKPSARPQTQSA
jgi:exodeoxyribonuclease III